MISRCVFSSASAPITSPMHSPAITYGISNCVSAKLFGSVSMNAITSSIPLTILSKLMLVYYPQSKYL